MSTPFKIIVNHNTEQLKRINSFDEIVVNTQNISRQICVHTNPHFFSFVSVNVHQIISGPIYYITEDWWLGLAAVFLVSVLVLQV